MRPQVKTGLALVLLLVFAPPFAAASEPTPMRVYAAASLQDAIKAIAADFTQKTGIPVEFNFAGSNFLASQIVEAGGADLFLSADADHIDRLDQQGLLAPGSRRTLLTNRLVVIAHRNATLELHAIDQLPSLPVKRLALANPDAVPAGKYAKAYLKSIGQWAVLKDRVVSTLDVRAALDAVASGSAPLGIVYKTDAAISDQVKVLFEISGDTAPAISYVAAQLADSTHPEEAARFLKFLTPSASAQIFARYGFDLLPPSGMATTGSAVPPEQGATFEAVWVSLKVALGATVLMVPFGFALAYLLARKQFFGKSLLVTVTSLPLVMPPTAIGFALLHALGRHGLFGIDLDIVFTWKGAVLASAVMAFPLLVRTARVAFENVNPRLEKMGRTLGMSPATVLARITMPLAARGLLAAGLLGFSRALGEFGATIIVAGSIAGKTETLAMAIFNNKVVGHDGEARLQLLAAAVIAFGAIFLVEMLTRRKTFGARH